MVVNIEKRPCLAPWFVLGRTPRRGLTGQGFLFEASMSYADFIASKDETFVGNGFAPEFLNGNLFAQVAE